MSTEMTSEEDLDDLAFRALLEPLALQVLPGRAPSPARETPDPAPPPADLEGDNLAPHAAALTDPPGPVGSDVPPDDLPPPPAAAANAATESGSPPIAASHVRVAPLAPEVKPVAIPTHFDSRMPRVRPELRWQPPVAVPGRPTVSPPQVPQESAPPAAPAARPEWSVAEVRQNPCRPAAKTENTARPNTGPRLVARAGPARDAARPAPARPAPSPPPVVQRAIAKPTALPPARVRWSVVLLAGAASAVTVAGISWLSSPPSAAKAPTEAAAGARPGAAAPVVTPEATIEPRQKSHLAPEPAPIPTPGRAPAHTLQPTPGPAQVPAQSSPLPKGTQADTSSQDMIGLLTQRGDRALADGDIIAARLLYERAAGLGSAGAAIAVGKTYDAEFLTRADAHGIRADAAVAAAWYRKAAALGDPDAKKLLARVEAQGKP